MLLALLLAFTGSVVLHHPSGAEEALGGALVELRKAPHDVPLTAVTAIDGSFSIPGAENGDYTITIRSNYPTAGGSLFVTDDPRTFFVFEPTCGAAYGRVHDRKSGAPIAGAHVKFLGEATTDENGDYFIDWHCFSGPGFHFHNTFFYGAAAARYKPIWYFGGRGESFPGGTWIQDWTLRPLRPGAPR